MESQATQIKSVLEFLKSEKTRADALEIILGLVSNEEMHSVLLEVDLPKAMIRHFEASTERLEVLKVLVNMSGIEAFRARLIELNSVVRVLKYFLSVSQEESILGMKTKMNLEEIVVDNDSPSEETSLVLMLLSNLTLEDLGKEQLLGVTNEKTKGVLLLKLMERFLANIFADNMDFAASILANVSSLKEGRLFVLEMSLFKVFLSNFEKLNAFKLVNMLRFFRNCCFEYKEFEGELLEKDVFC